MKKSSLTYLLLAFFLSISPNSSEAAGLPEISGWQCGELTTTVFDTVSGNRGKWQERNYRTGDNARVHTVWIEGAGEKGWTPPAADISADDGLMGRGATYKTLTIAGEKALLEHHPITGYSLAVKIDKKGTLTLESLNASEKEIIDAAAKITETIR